MTRHASADTDTPPDLRQPKIQRHFLNLARSFLISALLTTSTTSAAPSARSSQVNIKIGSATFTATLNDQPPAKAFAARLPLTLRMTELNGNEKFFDFDEALPTNAVRPGTIQNGDLTLYGSRTLVLFYRSFQTPYSYTKLGRVNDPKGLAAALGTGNVTVTFEAK